MAVMMRWALFITHHQGVHDALEHHRFRRLSVHDVLVQVSTMWWNHTPPGAQIDRLVYFGRRYWPRRFGVGVVQMEWRVVTGIPSGPFPYGY